MINKTQNTTYVECVNGLCNRMLAIDSATSLAKSLNHQCVIIWPKTNSIMDCNIFDLFEPHPELSSIRYIPNKSKSPIKYFFYKLFYSYYCSWKSKKIGDLDAFLFASAHKDINTLQNEPNIYINTWLRFHSGNQKHHYFNPKPHLSKTIDKISEHFTNTIGIHIRGTDHPMKKYSPKELFINRMHEELQKDPSVNFFLSTDEPSIEDELKAIFPKKIITYKKRSLDRSTLPALEDAVIDLFTLSKTKRIIGSNASTFSQTAAELGNIKLDIITSQPSLMSLNYL